MQDLFNSANDPLFFMHHAGMDYVWALWQEHDLKRLDEFDVKRNSSYAIPLTLESTIWMGVFGADVTAEQVTDTRNRDGKGILCFKYEGLGFEKYMT
jgi:tyrosinase